MSPQKVLSQPGGNATNKAISEATVSDHSTSLEVIWSLAMDLICDIVHVDICSELKIFRDIKATLL